LPQEHLPIVNVISVKYLYLIVFNIFIKLYFPIKTFREHFTVTHAGL